MAAGPPGVTFQDGAEAHARHRPHTQRLQRNVGRSGAYWRALDGFAGTDD